MVGGDGSLTGDFQLRIGVVGSGTITAIPLGKEALFAGAFGEAATPFAAFAEMDRPAWVDLSAAHLQVV